MPSMSSEIAESCMRNHGHLLGGCVRLVWQVTCLELRPPPFSPSVISFMPILNFAQWEAVDTEWLSPLAITLRNNNKWPDNLETMGYARQVADPQPFLTLAAKNAYWQAPMICLLALAKKEYEITLTGNDAEKLLTLIQAALTCSGSQALVYLEMRVAGLSGGG